MEQSTGLNYNLGQNQLLSMYMNMDNQNKLQIMMLQQQIKEMESQMNEMRTKIINQDKTKGNEENVNSESSDIIIIRENPTIIKKIKKLNNELESDLYKFFNMILIDDKKAKAFAEGEGVDLIKIDKNASKLYVNYYDIIKSEVYVDLNLNIKEIISNIFGQIFCPNFVKKIYKRIKEDQTTQNVILNPIDDIDLYNSFYEYENFLHLEYNKNNLSEFEEQKGVDIGLKEEDELFIKIDSELYDEINIFPKINVINISYNDQGMGRFLFGEQGILFKKIKKIFNFSSYESIGYFSNNSILLSTPSLPFRKKEKVRGAGFFDGFLFMDPSKAKIRKLEILTKGPKWRYISEGLNIFGICKNKDCEAYKKEVIYRTLENHGSLPEKGIVFNMIKNSNKIKCPICNRIFDPITCGFYKCEYQFIGKKNEDGVEEDYDSKTRETKGGDMEYYEPNKGKKAKWFKLKIFVLPFQKIKYKPN